jgi:hypothetical protein
MKIKDTERLLLSHAKLVQALESLRGLVEKKYPRVALALHVEIVDARAVRVEIERPLP